MSDLRTRAAVDAKNLNIKDWGLPVNLIAPGGITYNTDFITGEQLKAVSILYDRVKIIPETGEDVIIQEPVVTFSRLSLERIPEPGEKWIVEIPESPTSSVMVQKLLSETRAPEGGKSLELILLYLQDLEQE